MVKGAADYQADLIVTVCPMCQLNLDAFQGAMNRYFKTTYHMPILYFTQMMGLASGRAQQRWASARSWWTPDRRWPKSASKCRHLRPSAPKRKRDDKSLPMPQMAKGGPEGTAAREAKP